VEKQLVDIFERFSENKRPVRVSFDNRATYDLRILSTMHAEEGGDVVADVVKTIQPPKSGPLIDWSTAAMNFRLEDVVRIEDGDERLFIKSDS
jgi:hypothetical protein